MSTSDIPGLLWPRIEKASKLAGAGGVGLWTDFETDSIHVLVRVRKGASRLSHNHHLFTSAELEDGSYKELFDQRLREIFGL